MICLILIHYCLLIPLKVESVFSSYWLSYAVLTVNLSLLMKHSLLFSVPYLDKMVTILDRSIFGSLSSVLSLNAGVYFGFEA